MKNRKIIIDNPFSVVLNDSPLREAKEDEAIIKVKSSSICGSDLHIYKGKHPAVKLPTTIGHEFSGEIVWIGKEDNGYKIGDRVVLEPIINCGQCEACLSGNYGLCENATFSYRVGDGAMADYVVGKTNHLFRLKDDMSYDTGAMIEPMAVSLRAVKRASPNIEDKVLIMGAGTIGILICAILKHKGIKDITIVDFAESRLKIAKELGAVYSINPKNSNQDAELKNIHAKGFDIAFECIGKEEVFNNCLNHLKTNGTLLQVGIFEEPIIKIDASKLINKQIVIKGTQGYNNDFEEAIEIASKIDLTKMITHIYPLGKYKEAIDCALNASKTDAIKVLIHPEGEKNEIQME